MKKILFMALLGSLLFTACGENSKTQPEPEPQPDPVLTLTCDNVIEVVAEGCDSLITYTLENPTEAGVLTATASEPWVTNIVKEVEGQISFTVLTNVVEEDRTAVLTVAYETQSFTVIINQAAAEPVLEADVEREAPNLCGFYYGRKYSTYANYYVVFTDGDYASGGIASTDSYFYALDLYHDTDAGSDPKVPYGTYHYDAKDTCDPNTFCNYYSLYFTTDASGNRPEQLHFQEATLEVSEKGFDLWATMEDGSVHHVTFKGDYTMIEE